MYENRLQHETLAAQQWCWASEHQPGDPNYWLRSRNYMVTGLLASGPELGAQHKNIDNTRLVLPDEGPIWQVVMGECLWGAWSLSLMGPAAASSAVLIAHHVLTRAPWLKIFQSGWPLFQLLWVRLETIKSDLHTVGHDSAIYVIHHLKELHRSVELRCSRQAGDAKQYQPGNVFHAIQHAVEQMLPRLQQIMRRDATVAASKTSSELTVDPLLWKALAMLQEAVLLRGCCVEGSIVAPVRAAGTFYNVCVRQPEAIGGLLGASLVDRRLLNHGIWEQCEELLPFLPLWRTEMLEQHRSCIVVDVGANIGVCTLLFARLGLRVISVEAEPTNLVLLWKSLWIFQPSGRAFANVTIAALAADETAGTVRIKRDFANAGDSKIGPQLSSGEDVAGNPDVDTFEPDMGGSFNLETDVPTAPLDDIVAEHSIYLGGKLEDVCALKVDVEQAELRVFRGASRLLASQSLRVVNFEFVPRARDGSGLGIDAARELLNLLSQNGFQIRGSAPAMEERPYIPSEFDALISHLVGLGKKGTTLTAVRT